MRELQTRLAGHLVSEYRDREFNGECSRQIYLTCNFPHDVESSKASASCRVACLAKEINVASFLRLAGINHGTYSVLEGSP